MAAIDKAKRDINVFEETLLHLKEQQRLSKKEEKSQQEAFDAIDDNTNELVKKDLKQLLINAIAHRESSDDAINHINKLVKQAKYKIKIFEIIEPIKSHMIQIKSALGMEEVIPNETIDLKKAIQEILALGSLLSNQFDGAGKKNTSQETEQITGMLVEDIGAILRECLCEFEKTENMAPSISRLLNAIDIDSEELYTMWASNGYYDTSNELHQTLKNQTLDNFRKGKCALFTLVNHHYAPESNDKIGTVMPHLFSELFVDEQCNMLRQALIPIRDFINKLGPLAKEDADDPLIKLEQRLNQFEDLQLSPSLFINDFCKYINEIAPSLLIESEHIHSNDSSDAGATDEESLDSTVSHDVEIETSTESIHNGLKMLEQALPLLKRVTEKNTLKRSAQIIFKSTGLNNLLEAINLSENDTDDNQYSKLKTLMHNFSERLMSFDAFKTALSNQFDGAKNSALNVSIQKYKAPGQMSKLMSFKPIKTPIMEEFKKAKDSVLKINDEQSIHKPTKTFTTKANEAMKKMTMRFK